MRKTLSAQGRERVQGRLVAACLLAILLVACQNAAAPATPARQASAPSAFVPLAELMTSKSASGQATTAGYLIVDSAGATLVDGVGFAADGTPHLLGDTNQIWLGAQIDPTLKAQLRAASAFQFAPVRVRGQLDGPGGYGPSNRYHYQLLRPSIDVIVAQETTIGDLLDHPANYESRLVRLVGNLIAGNSSALLVDQLGPGGLPMPKARQIKLRTPLQDSALLGQLTSAPGGAIRFGRIQVEGFWRAGVLIPLSAVLVT